MARQLVCDACGTVVPHTENDVREWTDVHLHKLGGPVFQRSELCPICTAKIRGILMGARTTVNPANG